MDKASNRCMYKANKVLGFIKRNSRSIRITRRSMYLALVRPHLGYAPPVWAPETKDLMRQVERIQRRATKFILRLPFISEQSYKDRLLTLNLLLLSYWYEYSDNGDMIFFFKIVNGHVDINLAVIPKARNTRPTRSNRNPCRLGAVLSAQV